MQLLVKVIGSMPRSWIQAVSRSQWRHPLLRRGFEWAADRFRDRDGVIQQGIGKGLRFNPGRSNAGYLLGTAEPGLQHVLSSLLKPGMTVYDVGANVGFVSVLSAHLVGSGGRVFSFEPLPSNADQVEHNARLNQFSNITVRREAIGLADTQTRFLVSSVATLGMLESSGFAKPSDEIVGEIPVTVRSLDSLRAEGTIPPPDVIKVDTEGVEADILLGSAETIRTARPILLIELHGTNVPIAKALDDLGFHAVVMGSKQPVAEAYWNAFVIAAPEERRDLVEVLDQFRAAEHEAR